MSSHNHMPPVPPANRTKDAGASHAEVNTAEQGDTANIRQNTTNKGFFQGSASSRRGKRREPARRSTTEPQRYKSVSGGTCHHPNDLTRRTHPGLGERP
jgi:hypothetical protein